MAFARTTTDQGDAWACTTCQTQVCACGDPRQVAAELEAHTWAHRQGGDR